MKFASLCLKTLLSIAVMSSTSYAANTSSRTPVTKSELITSRDLNLKTIIKRALQGSPRLKSAKSAVAASKGKHTQSGLYVNPEINIQAENIAGGGRYRGTQSAEITYGVSQVIETGGKRSKRKKMTQQDVAFSHYSQMLETLDVIYEANLAYASAVAAQEMLRLADEQKKVAEDLYKEVSNRVKAAREPLIQKSKAQITLSTTTFACERAKRNLSQAKFIISNLWGEQEDSFELEKTDFFNLTPPMTKAEVKKRIEENIYFKRMKTAQARLEAQYELEKANSLPDPRINVGVRDFRDTGHQAWVVGVSVPIPLFNQNQGNIKQALHEISKAKFDTKNTQLELINAGYKALEDQINAYQNADNLKTSILPSAEKAFSLSFQGYREGKLPYIEVLDALRTLFELKEQYLSVLRDYHIAKAEVERLTAKNVKHSEL